MFDEEFKRKNQMIFDDYKRSMNEWWENKIAEVAETLRKDREAFLASFKTEPQVNLQNVGK